MKRTACVVAVAFVFSVTTPRRASAFGLTVTDLTNFAQNLISAIEAVDQTLTQIQQYELQLRQFDEMVRNGAAPLVYTWDKLNSIHDKLRNFRLRVLDLDEYLKKFLDLDFYRGAQCYDGDLSCPKRVWDQILQDSFDLHSLGGATQKESLDILLRSLEASEKDLETEAQNLEKLQLASESADGQLKAIQVGNQLASAQTVQLMQLRAIMVAQYRATALQAQRQHAIEAQARALSERYRRPMYEESDEEQWAIWPEGM